MVEKFVSYADKHGLKRRNLLIKKSHKLLDRVIDSRIIYNMLDEQAWTQYINLDDPVIKKTLDVFENHAAFPKKPEPAKKRAAKKEKIAMANTPYNYSSLHHNNCMIANA